MSGRHAPRSKKGCLSCRVRKLKCDEQRPQCLRCTSGHVKCDWDWVSIPRRSARKAVGPRENCRSIKPLIHRPSAAAAEVFTYQIDQYHDIYDYQPPLTRSLGTDHISLQNSLILSLKDRELFQFFPRSILAFNYGKAWEWSAPAYIYRELAKCNSSVMHMVMAMGAKELHLQQATCSHHNTSLRPLAEAGEVHYCHALSHLSQLLHLPVPITDETIDTILTLFYLMVFYEAQFGDNNATTSIHLQGLVSFFRSSKQLSGTNGDKLSIDRLPPLSQHLLLLTLACTLAIIPERPDTKASFHYFLNSEKHGMFYDQLFQAAHHTIPRVWDIRYPAEELLDDLENLRALDLIHECSKLRYEVEILDQSSSDLPLNTSHMMGIREGLRRVKEKFEDLLRIAKLAQVPDTALRRVMRTTLIAAADLYGMEVFCHRVVCCQFSEIDCHQSSLKDLMETAKKTLNIDMRLLGRICWPMLMASMETKDMAEQTWICKTFQEMNAKHGSLLGIERRLKLA